MSRVSNVVLQNYISNGIRSNTDLTNPKPVHLSLLKHSNVEIVHQLSFWEDMKFPDEVYLNRFKVKPYHHRVVEYSKSYPGVKKHTGNLAKYKKEETTLKLRPLMKKPEDVTDRTIIYNYSQLSEVNTLKGSVRLKAYLQYEYALETMVDNVRQLGRSLDRPQYIYLNVLRNGFSHTEYKRLLSFDLSRLSLKVTSFEEYLTLKLIEWVVYGKGPLSTLGSVDNVFVVVKDRARGFVYLSSLIRRITSSANVEIDDAYTVSVSGALNEEKRVQIMDKMFSKLTEVAINVGDGVDKQELEDDEPQKEQQEEFVLTEVDVSELNEPKDISGQLKQIETDLLKEPTSIEKDIKTFRKALDKNQEITVDGTPLGEMLVVDPKEVKVPRRKLLEEDKLIGKRGMADSILPVFDKVYIDHVLEKHMMKVFQAFIPSGLVPTNISREVVEDIVGGYIQYKVTYTLANGGTSTEIVRIPIVDDEGFFTSGNSKYRMRKQSVDLPIRKINSKRTALTTYYGTLMVDGPKLAVDDFVAAFSRRMKPLELTTDYTVVRNDVYDPRLEIDDVYSRLSKEFEYIKVGTLGIEITFSYDKDMTPYKGGYLLLGKKKASKVLIKDEKFYLESKGKIKLVGDIFDLFEMDIKKKPIEVATVNILGTRVYVGILLSYLFGFSGLLKKLKVKTTTFPKGKRVTPPEEPHFLFKFKNGSLLITNLNKTNTMILQGLNKYLKRMKEFNVSQLEVRDNYLDFCDGELEMRHVREFNILDKQFIDPISEEVLKHVKAPTWFRDVLIHAVDLLNTNHYPNTADNRFTRYRGYERFAGITYNQILRHLRVANNQVNRNKRKLNMSQFAVWQSILGDDSNKIAEETNPLGWMKEQESVTLSGINGRSKDSLTMEVRKFHPTMVGTIGETVPDDGNVGMVAYLTANPNIDNIYGIPTQKTGDINTKYAENYSSGYNFMAAISNDDFKRRSFATIQNSHTIAIENCELPYVRTGYEYVIPQRIGKTFCQVAPLDGTVTKISEHGITLEYVDGSTKSYTLGTVFGKAEGSMYPSKLITNLRKGDKVKARDGIAWNEAMFEYDIFAKKLAFKHSIMARLCLLEGEQTYEDSCAASKDFVGKVYTKVTKLRSIKVKFTDEVHDVMLAGEEVSATDYLLVIQDGATVGLRGLTAEVKDSLSELTQSAPKAKYEGKIERIEVFYHGDKENMSPTLAKLTADSDKLLTKRSKAGGGPGYTGKVSAEYRSDGSSLPEDVAEIRVHIEVNNALGNSDKVVCAHQLKTTIGEIEDTCYTEDGLPIDIKFSRIAVDARIVGSPDEIMVLSTCLSLTPPVIEKLWNS